MDLELDAEQRLLVESARGFLGRACPVAHVRAMEADGAGFSRALWREMAALGWLGMGLPDSAGGGGRSFLDSALLCEEMGRALLPAPFLATCVVAAPIVAELARGAERDRRLGAIARGETIATLALAEPGWRDEWGEVATELSRPPADHGALVLAGRKHFVSFAAAADLVLVVARARGGALADGAPESLCVVAVERDAPGVSMARLDTLGGDHQYEVRFDEVRVPPSALLGALSAGEGAQAADCGTRAEAALERAQARAAVASVAYGAGAARRVLEMTVDYARTREQFGRPIGSFQAVAHRCVDMRSDVDAIEILARHAAWSLDENDGGADLAVATAKAYAGDALRRIFAHAHQVHGAIGFSMEHDLQLFSRRAKAIELAWGSAAFHRERVARAIGL
jgi:alkylation response protein AidB-like acyl-CoA dehydrogenase